MLFLRRRKSFTILGSCVSRDIFECVDKNKVLIDLYLARTKFFSQLVPPLGVGEEEVELTSPFQKRLVLNDLNKGSLTAISESKSCFCMLDFIDERFNLLKVGETYITKSPELVRSGWPGQKNCGEIQYVIGEGTATIDGEPLEPYLVAYLKRIEHYFPTSRIVLHEAFMMDYYLGKDGQKKAFPPATLQNNKRINAILDYLYSFAADYLKRCKILNLRDKYEADETHKWGLGPMHYQKGYYEESAKFVLEL